MSFRLPRRRLIVVSVLALGIATAVYGYAATNTVPNSSAGSGSGTISGYTVTNVAYTLNSTTPTNLDQVTFTIAPDDDEHAQGAAGGSRRLVHVHERRG